MEPEITTPNKSKKKFLIITLGILLVITSVAYYIPSQEVPLNKINIPPQILESEGLTESEKLLKAQSDELDKLRKQQQGQSTQESTTTVASQAKRLDILRNQILKQQTIKKTAEEQAIELDTLRASTINSKQP